MINPMIILDTNVVSEAMQLSPSPAVMRWYSDARSSGGLFLTTITVAEILYGVALLPPGKRRDKLQAEAEATFVHDFPGRLLPFDEQAARLFGDIATGRRRQGRPINELDAQIASIARAHGAPLATRNVADFKACGVQLVNPWEA
jgi:toxin FitB